jgi:lactate permease
MEERSNPILLSASAINLSACREALSMDQNILFIFAILPILVIFIGLVFFRKSGTLMAFIGWALTVIIAVSFFNTSLSIALYASLDGIIASFGISLMVLFTILQVTMMDIGGAIRSITEYIREIAAERYDQIMLLNVGLGSFLVSIGATPVTMLPPIMLALGFSPLASVALPCLGYDPLTSFSLLAVPITLPAAIFGLNVTILGSTIALFLPVVCTGFALGMLWLADGVNGLKKGLLSAIIAGLSLGLSCILFVNILPASAIGLVGVFSGLVTIIVLLIHRKLQGKSLLVKREIPAGALPLWKAALPWILLVIFIVIISIPAVQTGLYNLLGDLQKIPIVGDRSVDIKLFNQAYFWVLISTLVAAPFLITRKGDGKKIVALWLKRAWSPTLATAIFFAIAYVMDWSGQSVIQGAVGFAPGAMTTNMNVVIGLTLAGILGIAFPLVSPLLGLFGSFVSGSETSSNVMFYGILKSSSDVLSLDFIKVYAAHAVAGGIASSIAPAKIMNAAAVIDQPGIIGEVIMKSAVVAIILTAVTGVMLVIMLAL